MRGIIAEYERVKILERTARGRLGHAKAGYPPASTVPLASRYMKHADKGGHYEIDPIVGGRLRCGQCGRSLSSYLDVYGHGRYRCTLQPYQDEGQTHTKRSIPARSTASGLEQEIAHHEAEQRRLEQTQVEVAALQDYCARVRANLQHCTMEEKQRALETLDIRVTWHPEKPLEIRGSIPLDGTSGGGSMACRRHLCLLAQLSPIQYARPGHPVPREPPLP